MPRSVSMVLASPVQVGKFGFELGANRNARRDVQRRYSRTVGNLVLVAIDDVGWAWRSKVARPLGTALRPRSPRRCVPSCRQKAPHEVFHERDLNFSSREVPRAVCSSMNQACAPRFQVNDLKLVMITSTSSLDQSCWQRE